MDRKFQKKAGPFGTPPPPGGPPSSPPGGAGPAGLPSTPPRTPPAGLGGPPGGSTPPAPPAGLTSPSGHPPGSGTDAHDPAMEEGLKPRMPSAGPESDVPTNVHVDAATGEVRIEKPRVNIHISAREGDTRWIDMEDEPGGFDNPISNGVRCDNCKGTGIFLAGDCHICGGSGFMDNAGDGDAWNYTHAPRENYLSTRRRATLRSKVAIVEDVAVNNLGEQIHGRPAAMLARTMKPFQSVVTLTTEQGSAVARKPNHVNWLGIMPGDQVTVTAEGPDEQEALQAALDYINGGTTANRKFNKNSDWDAPTWDAPESDEGVSGVQTGRVVYNPTEFWTGTISGSGISDDADRFDVHMRYPRIYEYTVEFPDGTKEFVRGDEIILVDNKKKSAVNPAWVEFKANDNEPQYGNWGEPALARDTHEDPYALPKNRLVPPLYTVKATVPEYMNQRSIAYVLQTTTMLDVTLEGQNMTIEGVANPVSLISELKDYGIDASVSGGNPDSDTNTDFYPGQKVAMVGDYPDMNYYYRSDVPPVTATLIGKTDNGYMAINDMWGRFEAREDEMRHV